MMALIGTISDQGQQLIQRHLRLGNFCIDCVDLDQITGQHSHGALIPQRGYSVAYDIDDFLESHGVSYQ
jgi:hypothetical protein